jgi:2-oxoglutarate dehydrogenase E2 component (dihydrolipoamide succinyltransferase)
MPQLGETVAEATVTRWLKDVGDQVAEGEPLFEVSTDKTDVEIPSSFTGMLQEIVVAADRTVPVGSVIAVIGEGAPAGARNGSTAPHRSAAPAAPPRGPGGSRPGQGPRHHLTSLVRRLLREHGLDARDIIGTGPNGRITRSDVHAAHAMRQVARSRMAGSQVAGAQATGTQATGAQVAVAERPAPAQPRAAVGTPAAPPGPVVTPPAQQAAPEPVPPGLRGAPNLSPGLTLDDVRIVPFTSIRRATAAHMVRSKATSPHTLMVVEADYSAVDRARAAVAESWRAAEGSSLTYLPFVARAVVEAIAKFPHVNASVGDDELLVYNRVNLGIAVDLDADGLVVPVVRDADGKRLRAIARDVTRLARTARERKSTADDFAGGTFTISNPGPYGTLLTAAVINQPQVAILATDAVTPRPVAVEVPGGGYAVVVRPVGNLALSFDHRAIDGGYAARFLREVKNGLEQRDWSAEL